MGINAGNVYVGVKADTSDFKRGMKNAKNEATDAATRIENAFKKVSFQSIEKRIDSVTNRIFSLQGTIAVLAGGYGLQALARSFWDTGVKADSMSKSMLAALGSAEKAAAAQKFLREQSERLGLVYEDQIKAYKGIAAAAKDTALEGENVNQIYLAVAEASTALQLSSEETEGALYALSQMISKGTVQAEELRGQLGERLPGAFQIAAKAIGVSTAELGKMLEQGKIISEDFLPKFSQALRLQYAGAVDESSKSAQANVNRFINTWGDLERTVMASGVLTEISTQISSVTQQFQSWLTVNEDLIKQKVPEYIEEVKSSAQKIWDIISYDPAIIEYGLIGLVVGGRNGAVIGASLGHMKTWVDNLSAAFGLALAGIIDFSDIATANFQELQAIVNKFDSNSGLAILEKQARDATATIEDLQDKIANAKVDEAFGGSNLAQYEAELLKAEKTLADINAKIAAIEATTKKAQPTIKKAATESADAWMMYYDQLGKGPELMQDFHAELDKVSSKNASIFSQFAQDVGFEIGQTDKVVTDFWQGYEQSTMSAMDYELLMLDRRRFQWEANGIDITAIETRYASERAGIVEKYNKQSLSKVEEYWKHTFENIHDTTADIIYDLLDEGLDSFEDFFDQIEKWFLKLIANMAAQEITLNVSNALGITGGSGAGATSIFSGLSSLSDIGSLFSSSSGWGLTELTSVRMSEAGEVLGSTSEILTQNIAAYAGLVYEAYGLLEDMGDEQYWNAASTAFGAAIGGVLTGWAGPVGIAIGGALGDIVGGFLQDALGSDAGFGSAIDTGAQYGKWGDVKDLSSGAGWRELPGASGMASADTLDKINEAMATAVQGAYDAVEAVVSTFPDEVQDSINDYLQNLDVDLLPAAAGLTSNGTLNITRESIENIGAFIEQVQSGIIKQAMDGIMPYIDEAVGAVDMSMFAEGSTMSQLKGYLDAGVQDGDYTSYLQAFAAFQEYATAIGEVFDGINEEISSLFDTTTTYQETVDDLNGKFDAWIDTLESLGVSEDKINEIEDQRTDTINKAIKKLQDEALDSVGGDWEDRYGGLTDFEKELKTINADFDGWIETLRDVGMAEETITEWETRRTQALNAATEASEAAARASIEQAEAEAQLTEARNSASIANVEAAWLSYYGGLTELEKEYLSINAQFDTWIDTLREAGVSEERIIEWEIRRTDALNAATEAAKEAVEVQENLAETYASTMDNIRASLYSLQGGTDYRMSAISERYGWENYGSRYERGGMYNFDNILADIPTTVDEIAYYANALGMSFETLADDVQYIIEAAEQFALKTAEVRRNLDMAYNRASGGTDEEYRMKEIYNRYGWGGYGTRYNMGSDVYNFGNILSDLPKTVEEIQAWAKYNNVPWEDVADDVLYLIDAFTELQESMKAVTAQINEALFVAEGGTSDQYRMKEISEKYGWGDYGSQYNIGDNLYDFNEIMANIPKTVEGIRAAAAQLDIPWEEIADDVTYLIEAFTELQNQAVDFSASIQDTIDNYELSDLEKQIKNANKWYQEQLDILDSLQQVLTEEQYQDQFNDINKAWGYMLEEIQESTTNAWKNIVDSISSTILNMQTSTDNPADAAERLGIQQQAIADYLGGKSIESYVAGLSTDEDRQNAINELMSMYGSYLSLGQEAYQRPSAEYQSIYDQVLAAYENMQGIAENYMTDYDIQLQQLDVLQQIAANTSPLGSYASGTDYVPQTGIYQLHQGEKVIPVGGDGGSMNLNFTLNIGSSSNPRETAKEVKQELESFLRSGIGRKLVQQAAARH